MIDTSPMSRHTKIALSFSGGKDSLALVYLLRPFMDRITIYHMDTGDLLPEMIEVVEHVKAFWPDFIHVRGDVLSWINANGMPTDLLPHSAHAVGRHMGEEKTPLVSRYDCCFQNLMWPIYSRIKGDGNTMLIRGTKRADMKKLPFVSGENPDGVEIWMPLQDWSHDEVFAYLRSVNAPICRVYDHVTNSPECALCTAWWTEGRGAYLRQYHPRLFAAYQARMSAVLRELDGPLAALAVERAAISGGADG